MVIFIWWYGVQLHAYMVIWCSYVCLHVVWLCSAECSHGTCVYMMLCLCSTMCLYGAVDVFSCVFIWCCSYVQLCVHMVIRCWAMCFYSTVVVPSVCLYCNMMFFCVCFMVLCWLCLVLCLYGDMTHVLSRTWVPHLLVMTSYLWFDFLVLGFVNDAGLAKGSENKLKCWHCGGGQLSLSHTGVFEAEWSCHYLHK